MLRVAANSMHAAHAHAHNQKGVPFNNTQYQFKQWVLTAASPASCSSSAMQAWAPPAPDTAGPGAQSRPPATAARASGHPAPALSNRFLSGRQKIMQRVAGNAPCCYICRRQLSNHSLHAEKRSHMRCDALGFHRAHLGFLAAEEGEDSHIVVGNHACRHGGHSAHMGAGVPCG